MAKQNHDQTHTRSQGMARRVLVGLTLAISMVGLAGCETIGDYLNLRNSLLSPNEVGRFDKDNPFGAGEVKPVRWPILDQIDAVDEPVAKWSMAADPTAADLVVESKEYPLGSGDVIRISVYELLAPGMEFLVERQINDLGFITMQNMGSVKAAGLTPTELEQKLAQDLVDRRILPPAGNGQMGPQIAVTVTNSRQRVYSIIGAVNRPGTYSIPGGEFRLLDAIALPGDLNVLSNSTTEYVYIIRAPKSAAAVTAPAKTGVIPTADPTVPTNPKNSTTPETSPSLKALEDLEKSLEAPKPATEPGTKPSTNPSTTPGALLPSSDKQVVQATNMNTGAALALATSPDLERELNAIAEQGKGTAKPTTPETPVTTTTVVPEAAATQPVLPATMPTIDVKELEAIAAGTQPNTNHVFVDGKWTAVKTTNGQTQVVVAAPSEENARVIRVPIAKLREGQTKYNIVIKPGDIIHYPSLEAAEFYIMGHVTRPGVYTLTGRKVTLRQAIAAAGNLDGLAIPRRCELVRRIGNDQEAIVQVNLQKIFNGEQPDIFLKANDTINVGTDMLAPFLAVTRNAYRATYGWGTVYDRNYSGN
jgi:protein involved in polysaccharide export with SLBB domain